MPWVLAVDFGTTNTVAAVADPAGVRVLNVNGRPVMASAVFLHDDGWYVGDAAVRMARHRLDRFEACPKRAIPDGTLFLGGHDVPVADAITALFRPLLAEALEQHGGQPPNLFVVTHPATWTASRIEVLLHAAAAAVPGPWPRPLPLVEPVAAAQRVLHVQNMPPVARLVVLDLGGGTTDVTVVDRHGDRLTIVGDPLGRDGLGGVDFDLRLARWMVEEVNAKGLYDRLAGSPDPELRERAVDIREHARDVKEQLSQQAVVPAQLPKSPPELPNHTPVQVSRPMLETLIRGSDQEPGLEQAVALVDDALRAAPPGPPMAGVFLVGGSSRIPLLGALVTHGTGRIPIRHGDPTTAVAEGAARFGWGVLHGQPANPAAHPSGMPFPPGTPPFPPGTPPAGMQPASTPAGGAPFPAGSPSTGTPFPGGAPAGSLPAGMPMPPGGTPAGHFAVGTPPGGMSFPAGSSPPGSTPAGGSPFPPGSSPGGMSFPVGSPSTGTPFHDGTPAGSLPAGGTSMPPGGTPAGHFPAGMPFPGSSPGGTSARRTSRTKVALLVVLLALLVGGGIFTYVQLSDSSGGDPPPGGTFGTVLMPVDVFESPSLSAPVLSSLDAGEQVEIRCTTYGEIVVNGATGQSSDLWNGVVGGGYVPDVAVNTGTTLPTMPPC